MALSRATHDTPRRRSLRFDSVEDLTAEINRIVEHVRAGRARTTGNWTPAQIFDHVARLIEYSYDGFPFRARWPVRAAAHVAKWVAWKRFVHWALQPGYALRGDQRVLLPDSRTDFESAARRLRAAVARIAQGEPMLQSSPFEGRLTHDQWVYGHLRHAELHLGFIELSAVS